MDDQVFNLFRAVAAGMNERQREEVIEILRNPPTGRTPADLVQLLDLKRVVDELTRLCNAYRERSWRDIDGNNPEQVNEFREHYLRLHKQIVDYFGRIQYGNFSSSNLDRYASIQERIVLEDRLAEKRSEIKRRLDFYHQVATLPDQIRQLSTFNLQRAIEYSKALVVRKTNSSGEVTEDTIRRVLSEGDNNNPEYLHGKWFLARLFIEQQPERIEAITREVDAFERSFKKASPKERQALTAFKRNQDPKYNAQNYYVAYQGWCLGRFKELIRK